MTRKQVFSATNTKFQQRIILVELDGTGNGLVVLNLSPCPRALGSACVGV